MKLFLVAVLFFMLLPHAGAVNERIDFGVTKTGSITSPDGWTPTPFPVRQVMRLLSGSQKPGEISGQGLPCTGHREMNCNVLTVHPMQKWP